ncbi:MAG: threonine synthase, partial [Chloroflexi bacterium]
MTAPPALLERYRTLLAQPEEPFPITLGEGATPLIRTRRLGAELGLENLYLKYEGTNPTGSFKDRGMVLAVNRAASSGARAVVCASTGNTAASAAAYAAAADLPCFVILPFGKVARGKLAQALIAGARLVMVDGNFDEALTAVRRLGEEGVAAVVNSVYPDRLDGQQTAAWEVCDALGRPPDAL